MVTTPQIILVLANLRPCLQPTLLHFCSAVLTHLAQGWPVKLVVIHKFRVASIFLIKLRRRDVFAEVLIEDHLFPRHRINKWTDQLEESIDEPGYCPMLA